MDGQRLPVSASPGAWHPHPLLEPNPETNSESRKAEDGWWEVMLPEMVGQRRLILSAVDELRPLVSLSPVDRRLKRVPETNPEANSESTKPEDDWWEVVLARMTSYRRPVV